MYNGDYDQEAIFLNKELDRKRIEDEKCEAILYRADYEVINSWNKDIRETRVVKFIHDNGTVYHGVYRGIDVDKNAPNSISNTLSTDEFFGSGDFWCAETEIPGDLEETPCEIWLGNRDIDGNIDWNNSVCLNEKALKEWAANYEDKTVEVTFTANIPEEKIGEIKVNRNKEDIRELKIKVLGDTQPSEDSRIYGYAPAELKLKDVEATFKTAYENKDKFKYNGVEALQDCFPEMDLFDNVKVEGYDNNKDNEEKLEKEDNVEQLKENKLETDDVFEGDNDDFYFYVSDNERGCYQNVEEKELRKYLPQEGYTEEELEEAINKWANDNLDISRLPCIEDATPAMRLLYKRVSTSENNMFYLDLEEGEDFKEIYGMSQKEFEQQVDSDVKKYGLEDVVVKDYNGALYACFGNLQSSFTEKVERYNANVSEKENDKDKNNDKEKEKEKEETKKPTFEEFFIDLKKLIDEYDRKGLPKKDIVKKIFKIFNPDGGRQREFQR